MKACLALFFGFLSICGGASAAQERFRQSPPYPDPLQELGLPQIQTARLTNGLTLAVAYKENLPVISLQLVVFAGEKSSPPNFLGMATFTADMLNKGTLTLSSSDIEEIMESIGGHFSVSTWPDFSVFTFIFLEEHLDTALDILAKMILQPTFPTREIDSLKRTMFYDILDKGKEAEFVAKRHLLRLLFNNHPYQNYIFTEDVIRNINQKEILGFFDRFYIPNNALLVLTGHLTLTVASRKVSHYLNTWQPKKLEEAFLPSPEPNAEERICFIDMPQVKDPIIFAGNIIMPRSHQDYFPFIVLNQVLGGTPNSRLFMNLRESKGFAYFAFSELEFYRRCGILFVRARVTPEVIQPSLHEILKELRRIGKEKVSTFELEQAKSYLIGHFPLMIERYDHFISKISEIQALNLGEEHWTRYYENIMLINAEQVFEAAQKYPLHAPVIVIVGDKKYFLDRLVDFEKIEVYDSKGNLQYTQMKGVDR